MQKQITIKLAPNLANSESAIRKKIAEDYGIKINSNYDYKILRRSIDARGTNVVIVYEILLAIGEAMPMDEFYIPTQSYVHNAKHSVIIIGAGPAGLFAAIRLIENGIKPIIIERGKNVKERRRDLAVLNKQGIVNAESNYCFGEGGAGTYSDGKLYTRSGKRGSINAVLKKFVYFGAPSNIVYDAHPHIGTNKLPEIISKIRTFIIEHGGEIYFEKKLVDFTNEANKIVSITTQNGDVIKADAFILATGHSARDIYNLLDSKKILIEAKPFALGVRVEHSQNLINQIQYKKSAALIESLNSSEDIYLPPASYSLVKQVNDRGVFSFCMCPGGIIAPASTSEGELVVNGWSPSKRNNPFANSGMVMQIEKEDLVKNIKNASANDPLIFMKFQQSIEKLAYKAGGGNFVAPAQRMNDFIKRKESSTIPKNSYLPGLLSANLTDVLPSFIYDPLAMGFTAFGKKLKGYNTNDAIVVATESRTSSPVRIPRDKILLSHPQLENLYPCAEGAGYAGGIVSAAMDGENIVDAISRKILNRH